MYHYLSQNTHFPVQGLHTYIQTDTDTTEYRNFLKYTQQYHLAQGGPTRFFPEAKNSFLVGSNDQENHPGNIFEI
jgi:hypothetical protein